MYPRHCFGQWWFPCSTWSKIIQFRKGKGKFSFMNWNALTTIIQEDDWDRFPPITLPSKKPVPQLVVHLVDRRAVFKQRTS